MAKYDLLARMSKYLDAHLMFPLLEFTQTCDIYKEDDILRAKIELLKRTNMVDYAIDIYNAVNKTDAGSEELTARRDEILGRMRTLQVEAEPITAFISDPAKVDTLRGEKQHNSTFMKQEYGIGGEQVDALFHFAKFQFECGNYEAASEYLHHFRTYSLDADKNLSALWGKLGSEILLTHYDQAVETMQRLREMIDTHLFADALKQLEQRTWLLHWSLFVFWNVNDGRSKLIEMFMSERFMAALQINAPHLLRYLAAALLVNKTDKDRSNKWNSHLQQLMRIVAAEAHQYSDPVTDFLKCVYRDYDFDMAQEKLNECAVLMDGDFFLAAVKGTFMEQARMAIFEVYCRIHQCIDLNMLAERLSMQREEAERWIANLIRNARLNARIDSTAGTVVMGTQYIDPLDAIVERNNQLSVRTFKLANSIIDMSGGDKAVAV